VASVALLLALPKTPLYDRLRREGRLRPAAGEAHQLWNNWIATNVEPLRMSYGELIEGVRGLLRRGSGDAAIHQRIRNKLRHLGPAAVPFRLSAWATVRHLWRFLVRGVAFGGFRRWCYFALSLVPAVRNPRLLPFVVLNWTYGIAIQSFVRERL